MALRCKASLLARAACRASWVTSFKSLSCAEQRHEPRYFEICQAIRGERDAGLALILKPKQVAGESVIAWAERARRDLLFHPIARLLAGILGIVLDARAREVLFEDLFEGHPHAFGIQHNIDHFSSSISGCAGENSISAAATLW